MAKKWWIIPAVILCAAAVLVSAFWDAIVVRVAPKAVLTSALTNSAENLRTRLAGSPLVILAKNIDRNGQYTIEMEMDTTKELVGEVGYDMTVRTDAAGHRFLAKGTVSVQDTVLDLSVYLDEDFAALTSDSLLKGNYYGITYDTFSGDIRSSKVLEYLIGEKLLTQWEDSVAQLQSRMEKDYTFSAPAFSEEDLRTLMVGFAAMKANVSSEALDLGDHTVDAYRISFLAEETDIAEALPYLPESMDWAEELTKLSASFWVCGDAVVQISCKAWAGEEYGFLELVFGENAATDVITVRFQSGEKEVQITSDVSYNNAHYAEKLELLEWTKGVRSRRVIDYDWSGSGDMTVLIDGSEAELNFSETDDGFRLQTANFAPIMSLILDDPEGEVQESACTMDVRRGSQIETPEYKNMDQWSMSDLLILVGSVGSLFGIDLQ